MKTAIWISFVTLALIWTTFAFLAAGLARWTSEAIASHPWAETQMHLADSPERMTQKLTDATGRVVEKVATTVTQVVGEEQLPVKGPTAPAEPILPPLPEWVNQWLAPETVQSIEEWGVRANAAAKAGQEAVADAANATARTLPKARNQTQSTTIGDGVEVEASQAVIAANLQAAETREDTGVVDAPWLADLVGWLVPIVWVIWGIGLIIGLLLTLIAQWGVSRLIGSSLLKPTSPH